MRSVLDSAESGQSRSLTAQPPPPQYLSELSLVDSEPFLKYLPSHTAAATLLLALHTVTGESWVSLGLWDRRRAALLSAGWV